MTNHSANTLVCCLYHYFVSMWDEDCSKHQSETNQLHSLFPQHLGNTKTPHSLQATIDHLDDIYRPVHPQPPLRRGWFFHSPFLREGTASGSLSMCRLPALKHKFNPAAKASSANNRSSALLRVSHTVEIQMKNGPPWFESHF